MKIDWKSKLSSRKFWTAVIAYVGSLLTAFNISENIIVQVTTVVTGIGALIVYILAEAYVDGKRISTETTTTTEITIEGDGAGDD